MGRLMSLMHTTRPWASMITEEQSCRLLDVGGVGGLDESDEDFVSNGGQTVADYLNGNGVKSGLGQGVFQACLKGGFVGVSSRSKG